MVQKEFREPPRYMVGDIVYSHGFICVVCSVYPFNIDYSYDLEAICGKSLGEIHHHTRFGRNMVIIKEDKK